MQQLALANVFDLAEHVASDTQQQQSNALGTESSCSIQQLL